MTGNSRRQVNTIRLTYHELDVDEIEVTPEMIEAGRTHFYEFSGFDSASLDDSNRALVAAYIAMRRLEGVTS